MGGSRSHASGYARRPAVAVRTVVPGWRQAMGVRCRGWARVPDGGARGSDRCRTGAVVRACTREAFWFCDRSRGVRLDSGVHLSHRSVFFRRPQHVLRALHRSRWIATRSPQEPRHPPGEDRRRVALRWGSSDAPFPHLSYRRVVPVEPGAGGRCSPATRRQRTLVSILGDRSACPPRIARHPAPYRSDGPRSCATSHAPTDWSIGRCACRVARRLPLDESMDLSRGCPFALHTGHVRASRHRASLRNRSRSRRRRGERNQPRWGASFCSAPHVQRSDRGTR